MIYELKIMEQHQRGMRFNRRIIQIDDQNLYVEFGIQQRFQDFAPV